VPTYREPAKDRRAPLERPVTSAPRRGALLGSLAALAGAGAFAASQLELLAIAGAGALAALTHTWRESDERRQASRLASFLGSDEVALGPGTWTSPDGRRRVRTEQADGLVRFERLDPSTGETLASFRASVPVGPEPAVAEVIERKVAPVLGRARVVRCFDGLPSELGGVAVAIASASHVVLELRRDGVRLARCDADGSCIADTLHADVASALRQLEAEHGEHVGAFRTSTGRASTGAALRSARGCWDEAGVSRWAI